MTKEVPRTYVIRDEELIAYLRLQGLDKDIAAADRIEALIAERDGALEWLSASQGYIADAVYALDKQEAAEAQLKKAVETLEFIDIDKYADIEGVTRLARATLAEIKGESHE